MEHSDHLIPPMNPESMADGSLRNRLGLLMVIMSDLQVELNLCEAEINRREEKRTQTAE